MAPYGEIEAYTEPTPGVKRPLRIIASPGVIPVTILDKDGNQIDSSTPFYVIDESVLAEIRTARVADPLNTTETPLGVNQEWTGTIVPTLGYSTVVISITSDRDSAINGVCVDNFKSLSDTNPHSHCFTINAGENLHIEDTFCGSYYRIRYLNGLTEQSEFKLSAFLCKFSSGVHEHPLSYPLTDNHPAHTTRAVIAGKRPDGTYGNLRLSADDAAYTHNDPHAEPDISVHMTSPSSPAVNDTLAVAATRGSQTITVTNGPQWSYGDKFYLIDLEHPEFDVFTVRQPNPIVGNDLLLDRTLDAAHDIGTQLVKITVNMAIDGSVTPRTFTYYPRAGYNSNLGQLLHIHNINVVMESSGEPSLGRFGGGDPLTYGIEFKKYRPNADRDYAYWIPFRTFNAMELSGFNYSKEPKVLATWFVHLDINLMELSNVVATIDAEEGEYFGVTIRDNITTRASSMEIKLGIHEELR